MTLKKSDKITALLLLLAVAGAIVITDYVKSPHYSAGSEVKFTNNLCDAPWYCDIKHEMNSDHCTITEDC